MPEKIVARAPEYRGARNRSIIGTSNLTYGHGQRIISDVESECTRLRVEYTDHLSSIF